jgi:response regulator RpfG family c-di-GMP phosphodiesterase
MVAGQQQEKFFLTTQQLEERVRGISRQLISKSVEKVLWGSLQELDRHNHEACKGELRVNLIGAEVAEFVGSDPKYVVIGAWTHDIGKISIPLTTLNKSYSNQFGYWLPSDDEFMRIHPYLGYIHLMRLAEKPSRTWYDGLMKAFGKPSLTENERADLTVGAWIALTHHYWQNDPYPKNLPEAPEILKDLNLVEVANSASRLVTLADQYEACYRSNPKYGRPLNHDEAREEMFNFNPEESHDLIRRLFDEETGIF